MTILDSIVAYKRREVAAASRTVPWSEVESLARATRPPRGFLHALEHRAGLGLALIAEIKKASPSKGLIRPDFDPPRHARAYAAGGAACLSVLTDAPSFLGSLKDLEAVRSATALPLLRKDFIVDPYQIAEARAWGADCVLVIMACTPDMLCAELVDAATSFGLDVLFEVHNEPELERALRLPGRLIGINNRDLKTFETSLDVTRRLAPLTPSDRFVVSESGIEAHTDMMTLAQVGVRAFLVGESLMRQHDVEAATRRLLTGDQTGQSDGPVGRA